MVRLLALTALALIGNAIGLIVAAVILEDLTLNGAAFFVDVGIFTLAYVILQPLAVKMAFQHSATLAGGSALLATLVALIVTDYLSDGLSITGVVTWLLADAHRLDRQRARQPPAPAGAVQEGLGADRPPDGIVLDAPPPRVNATGGPPPRGLTVLAEPERRQSYERISTTVSSGSYT